ncbi:LicD family-domain-containing protein [Chytriomyces cf. hyalinus JEL632]|nr:LicD family-domain-containing protein [Chytriomyces cf. hyalinus JEL632]
MENGTNVSPRKAHLPINPFQPKKLNPLPTHINGSTPKNSQSPPNHDLSTSNKSLRALIKAWSQFCREQHISWWLTHGTLLGWHWNTRILPSDTDLDIQMSVRELLYLAARFNQTLLNSRFLVDVSPSIVICSAQAYSTIDARLIDTKTGYLMDITGLAILDGSEDTVVCKKPHAYQLTDILPLHETVFEGVKAWRPHAAFADSEGGVPRGCVGVNHVQTVYNITDIQVERWRQRVDRFLKLE